jgi:hypothetical protein
MSTLTVNDSKELLLARIAELEAKEARKGKLANGCKLSGYGKDGKQTITLIVSDKGALSFYGFNVRFPLTAYKQVVLFILDHAAQIREFIKANDGALSQGKE